MLLHSVNCHTHLHQKVCAAGVKFVKENPQESFQERGRRYIEILQKKHLWREFMIVGHIVCKRQNH
jgi:hypothetical protein